MSQYLRTLNRLEKRRTAAVVDTLGSDGEPVAEDFEAVSESPQSRAAAFPRLPLAKRHAAYATLLDDLRAAASSSTVPTIVLAGVSGFESIRPVVAGLGVEARRRSLRMLSGELALSSDGRILRKLQLEGDAGRSDADAEDSWSIELIGPQAPEALRDWFEHASAGYDLVLIEAPPLASMVDGALLAKAGDGLILVAEPQVTPRRALRSAIERSRAAGCVVLGLVMVGAREWLPGWLTRLVQARDRRG